MAGRYESTEKRRSNKGMMVILCVLVAAIICAVLMLLTKENLDDKTLALETTAPTMFVQTVPTTIETKEDLPVLETTEPIIETTAETIAEDSGSITWASFISATNMTTRDLTTKAGKSGTAYFYKDIELLSEDVKWIENPINKDGTVNQGAIYRKMAKLLAGFNMFLNDGSNYCDLLTGTTYSNRDEFAAYATNAGEFICMEDGLYHVLRKFETLESVDGSFDFPNDTFHFTIADLTACARQMQISEEMLGYVIAMMDEYAFSFSFEGNSCTFDYDALWDFGWN